MPRHFDASAQHAERLVREFDDKTTVKGREFSLRDIRDISQEFFTYADDLREWAEEKENEMVERGEI